MIDLSVPSCDKFVWQSCSELNNREVIWCLNYPSNCHLVFVTPKIMQRTKSWRGGMIIALWKHVILSGIIQISQAFLTCVCLSLLSDHMIEIKWLNEQKPQPPEQCHLKQMCAPDYYKSKSWCIILILIASPLSTIVKYSSQM